VAPDAVPADAVTASASGVDPQISPAYADLQAARVARVTGLPEAQVRELVAADTDGRVLGFLGEPTVDVTRLNLAVAGARAGTGG
jgi:K+-transporting ATPase ATPase C chain